ncbi:MAG: UDP-glucose/GDP-mannose dehydrogenase family protein [Candidatus Auribacter fodinae]|jgi:UDPglucose 6-dehydrogenase|uniref:UDP-glucose 6-dehydrogenase n=1 Tax=Candidatus Auribacter fodinae TaxID=2093366 RepID=A0A3A4QVZ9_9BACT|nr:MAG: UDP-glucose/GDP-mannose dehydrogenase family protein [Candidatus Auribacter fodinae]
MNLCIIGTGYVGLVTGVCLAELGHSVICIDNNEEKYNKLIAGVVPIYEPGLEELMRKNVAEKRLSFSMNIQEGVEQSQVIFICVNTPPKDDGQADLTYVEKVAREVATHMTSHKVIVDKSTVPVKTGEKVAETIKRYNKHKIDFDIVSNPEFLREGSAVEDTFKTDRIVIGVDNKRAEKIMREVYAPINAPVIVTDIKSAELIKHASNSFLAMKISFINALANICERSGANVEEVALGMGLDRRIGRSFLNAGIGYGGSCFPKDVAAFIKISDELGYGFNLLKEVEAINAEQVQLFIKKIEETLWVVKDKKIGVLGLAFKPNTDDMRNAPSIKIIEALLKESAHVTAYDPQAIENTKHIFPDIEYCNDPYAVAQDAEALIIVTEWDEFKTLDLEKVRKIMVHPIIIDGRNIFNPSDMEKHGFIYKSIGR